MSVILISLALLIHAIFGDKSQFNGFNYLGSSWGYNPYDSTQSKAIINSMVNQTNNNWIQFCFLWGQDTQNSTNIYRLSDTPSDQDVENAIKYAHSLGLKVVLRPGVNPQNGAWRGQIGQYWSSNASQWNEWFSSYTSMMTHYASIATSNNVEMFSVGFEYADTVSQTTQWENAINGIKDKYSGPLRYGANWGNEVNVKWWNKLDYIGIDAYYPLDASNSNPTLTNLENAWKGIMPGLKSISEQYNKPIIFAEIGYCSNVGTNVEPWACYASKTGISQQSQSNCYQAFFNTVYQQSYFKGVFWWDWSTSQSDSGPQNSGYTVNGKSAAAVCKQFFS